MAEFIFTQSHKDRIMGSDEWKAYVEKFKNDNNGAEPEIDSYLQNDDNKKYWAEIFEKENKQDTLSPEDELLNIAENNPLIDKDGKFTFESNDKEVSTEEINEFFARVQDENNEKYKDLTQQIYDEAVLNAVIDLSQSPDYDKLTQDEKINKYKEMVADNVMQTTCHLIVTQKDYEQGKNPDENARNNKRDLGSRLKEAYQIIKDPKFKGQPFTLAKNVTAAVFGVKMADIDAKLGKLKDKIKSTKIYTKVKELDQKLDASYPGTYKKAKEVAGKILKMTGKFAWGLAKTGAIGAIAGAPGLAVYAVYNTGKQIKAINETAKKEGKGFFEYQKEQGFLSNLALAGSVVLTTLSVASGLDGLAKLAEHHEELRGLGSSVRGFYQETKVGQALSKGVGKRSIFAFANGLTSGINAYKRARKGSDKEPPKTVLDSLLDALPSGAGAALAAWNVAENNLIDGFGGVQGNETPSNAVTAENAQGNETPSNNGSSANANIQSAKSIPGDLQGDGIFDVLQMRDTNGNGVMDAFESGKTEAVAVTADADKDGLSDMIDRDAGQGSATANVATNQDETANPNEESNEEEVIVVDYPVANQTQLDRMFDVNPRDVNALLNDGKWHSSAELHRMMENDQFSDEQIEKIHALAISHFDEQGHITDDGLKNFYEQKAQEAKIEAQRQENLRLHENSKIGEIKTTVTLLNVKDPEPIEIKNIQPRVEDGETNVRADYDHDGDKDRVKIIAHDGQRTVIADLGRGQQEVLFVDKDGNMAVINNDLLEAAGKTPGEANQIMENYAEKASNGEYNHNFQNAESVNGFAERTFSKDGAYRDSIVTSDGVAINARYNGNHELDVLSKDYVNEQGHKVCEETYGKASYVVNHGDYEEGTKATHVTDANGNPVSHQVVDPDGKVLASGSRVIQENGGSVYTTDDYVKNERVISHFDDQENLISRTVEHSDGSATRTVYGENGQRQEEVFKDGAWVKAQEAQQGSNGTSNDNDNDKETSSQELESKAVISDDYEKMVRDISMKIANSGEKLSLNPDIMRSVLGVEQENTNEGVKYSVNGIVLVEGDYEAANSFLSSMSCNIELGEKIMANIDDYSSKHGFNAEEFKQQHNELISKLGLERSADGQLYNPNTVSEGIITDRNTTIYLNEETNRFDKEVIKNSDGATETLYDLDNDGERDDKYVREKSSTRDTLETLSTGEKIYTAERNNNIEEIAVTSYEDGTGGASKTEVFNAEGQLTQITKDVDGDGKDDIVVDIKGDKVTGIGYDTTGDGKIDVSFTFDENGNVKASEENDNLSQDRVKRFMELSGRAPKADSPVTPTASSQSIVTAKLTEQCGRK